MNFQFGHKTHTQIQTRGRKRKATDFWITLSVAAKKEEEKRRDKIIVRFLIYIATNCVTFDATLKRGVPFMRKEISTPFSNSRRTLFQFRGHRVSAFNEIPINRELAGKRTTQTSTGFVEYKEGHNFSR